MSDWNERWGATMKAWHKKHGVLPVIGLIVLALTQMGASWK